MSKLFIATLPTFTAAGKYVEKGGLISEDELVPQKDSSEEEETKPADPYSGFIEAPSGVDHKPVVQVAAIAPTGPNPTAPQQLPPGAVQTVEGYAIGGATLVGEQALPEAKRVEIVGDADDDAQGKIVEKINAAVAGEGMNVSNEGTEGTVADVSARIADMDAAALDQLEKAENDREKPRKGVLDAIEARRGTLATA